MISLGTPSAKLKVYLPQIGGAVRVVRRVARIPSLLALALQVLSGLIQVAAFIGLQGDEYLAFSQGFILGSAAASVAVLNFENSLLKGEFSRVVWRYFALLWLVGTFSLLATLAFGGRSPHLVTFFCWAVCLRLFLAWSNAARAHLLIVTGAVALGAAATLLRSPAAVMLVGLLAMPALAAGKGCLRTLDSGSFRSVAGRSLSAFLRYLPHTVSGLALAYFDRFLALNVVGGERAETYLRTVQVCSWAAFLCFPVVFELRRRVLRKAELRPRDVVVHLSWLALALAGSALAILAVLSLTGNLPVLSWLVLAVVFLGILCSQGYQVLAAVNFVRERFSRINKITICSAALSIVVGIVLVGVWPTGLSLAVALLAGWAAQIVGTARSLLGGQRENPHG